MLTSEIVGRALRYWRRDLPLRAGKLIFESLPIEIRPRWAANILQAVIERTGIKSAVIEHVISIANCPNDWGKAHDAFSAVRDVTLQVDEWTPNPQRELLLSHLVLAENVAKVIYNSTNPNDEFDEDSGWGIAPCLKNVLDKIDDQEFSAAMWSVLCLDELPRAPGSPPSVGR